MPLMHSRPSSQSQASDLEVQVVRRIGCQQLPSWRKNKPSIYFMRKRCPITQCLIPQAYTLTGRQCDLVDNVDTLAPGVQIPSVPAAIMLLQQSTQHCCDGKGQSSCQPLLQAHIHSLQQLPSTAAASTPASVMQHVSCTRVCCKRARGRCQHSLEDPSRAQ